jgi:hypothetical protein
MGLITTDDQYYSDIADAIREVNNDNETTYTPSLMAGAIRNLGSVKGVKGDTEEDYRTGYVNITATDIGALPSTAVATSAEKDSSGNIISTYYEPKTNVTSKGDATLPVYFDANGVAIPISSYGGNSATADKLHSAVSITVGGATKSIDGSQNVEFKKSEIGYITAEVDGETLVLK